MESTSRLGQEGDIVDRLVLFRLEWVGASVPSKGRARLSLPLPSTSVIKFGKDWFRLYLDVLALMPGAVILIARSRTPAITILTSCDPSSAGKCDIVLAEYSRHSLALPLMQTIRRRQVKVMRRHWVSRHPWCFLNPDGIRAMSGDIPHQRVPSPAPTYTKVRPGSDLNTKVRMQGHLIVLS